MEDEPTLVTIFTGKPIEADMVRAVLESSGIEVYIQGEVMGIFVPSRNSGGGTGSVRVQVSQQDEDDAREALQLDSASNE